MKTSSATGRRKDAKQPVRKMERYKKDAGKEEINVGLARNAIRREAMDETRKKGGSVTDRM